MPGRPPSFLPLFLVTALLACDQSYAEDPTPPAGSAGIAVLPDGPWGRVEYLTLFLEPSESYVARNPDIRSGVIETIWTFPDADLETLAGIFRESGLSRDWSVDLLKRAEFVEGGDFIEVRPPEEIILGLSSPQRDALYRHISLPDRETSFSHPYALPPGGVLDDPGFGHGLAPEITELIDRLSFRRGLAVRFADMPYLFGLVPGEEQRIRIVQALYRETSLSPRLRIDSGVELSALAEYWSAGGRNRQILPLLESVVATPAVDVIDIAHLLPPLPRRLVHTYPSRRGWRTVDRVPDCFWTSFNFFAESPSDRHLESVDFVFEERYEPAQRPLQLGDLVLFHDEDSGEWIHACNYLAGDLVFTKNGNSSGRPWAIQRLRDVTSSYVLGGNVGISFLRLKPQYLR